MILREAENGDLLPLLELYTHLHGNTMPQIDSGLLALWEGIQKDANHHVIVGVEENALVCSCVLVIVPNLTHGQRPYALIENVITHPDCRNRGYATRALEYARRSRWGDIATRSC